MRMKKGLAHHHIPSQRDGGLFDFEEVWPGEHAEMDNFRHIGE